MTILHELQMNYWLPSEIWDIILADVYSYVREPALDDISHIGLSIDELNKCHNHRTTIPFASFNLFEILRCKTVASGTCVLKCCDKYGDSRGVECFKFNTDSDETFFDSGGPNHSLIIRWT